MAFTSVLEGDHEDRSGQRWQYEIVSLDTITPPVEKTAHLIEPGININWDGDNLNYTRALVGSSLQMSLVCNLSQRAAITTLLSKSEGRVGILVWKGDFRTTKGNSPTLEWAGHLLVEEAQIELKDEQHIVSLTFTCGLASLKYFEFTNDSGTRFIEDRATIERILFRAFQKLPAYTLIKEYEIDKAGEGGATGDWCWLRDIGVPCPLEGADPTPTAWDYDVDVISKMYVHGDTFAIPKNNTERHRNLFQEPDFVNTYDVVEDICKALGCTIMWSGQGWVMFNRTSFYHFADSNRDLVTNVHFITYDPAETGQFDLETTANAYGDYEIAFIRGQVSSDAFPRERNNNTVMGATEGRTLPLYGCVMTHEDIEADVLIAEGNARTGIIAIGGGTSNTLVDYINISPNRPLNNNDQYSFNRQSRMPYIFDFDIFNEEDTSYEHHLRNRIKFYDSEFRFGFPKRTNAQLSIAGGTDCQFKVSGRTEFRYHSQNLITTHSAFWPGGRLILKCCIEVRDTDGTRYRLRRPATRFTQVPQSTDVANNVDPSYSGDYIPILYQNLNWVPDTHVSYDDAYYDIILPHEDNINTEGDLQSELARIPSTYDPTGGPEQPLYGGWHQKWDEENNELDTTENEIKGGTYLNYFFNEDVQFQFPEDSDTTFDLVKMSWRLELKDHSGLRLWLSGTDGQTGSDNDPVWPDATNTQWPHYYYPKKVVLDRALFRLNNGEKGPHLTDSSGGTGNEVLNIGSSRLGSRASNTNAQVTGHIVSGVYTSPTNFDTNGETPALIGYGDVSLQWEPWGNRLEVAGVMQGPDLDPFASLHQLICHEYLSIYGNQKNSYTGRIISTEAGNAFYRPYQIFETQDYDRGVIHKIMFTRCSWNMSDGFSYEGISIDTDRVPIVHLNETDPVGPKPGHNPDIPVGFDFGVGSFGGVIGDIDDLVDDVADIKDTTDFITVTGNVDLDDVVDLTGKLQTLPDTSSTNVLLQLRTDGNLAVLADGTNGQFLKTDGSGTFTFDTVSVSSSDTVQIASRSPQLNLTTGTSYYFGNTSTGWEGSYVRNQATITSISYAFANCGIVCPKPLTSLSFMANIRSVNRTDDITVKVAKGGRPDGTTSAITLTELGSDTITVSQLYRFYKMDIDVTGITVKKGDLIFLFWYRDGVSVGAANYYTTWTLQGS